MASTLSRLEEIISRAQSLPERLAAAVVAAEQESLDEAQRQLLRQSEGQLSPADMRRMGHPFARRDPQTPIDPAVINVGAGDFLRGYFQEPVVASEQGTEGAVINDSESAGWIASGGHGKSRMVERPIIEVVSERIKKPRRERAKRAYSEVLKESV